MTDAIDTVVNSTATEVEAQPAPPYHIMLDLETWGIGNKACIVSIGAVKFTADSLGEQFHVGIDPASCQQAGLEIDASTVLWWMDPERRAPLDEWLSLEKVDLGSALVGFSQWSAGALAIWGNGSTFDNVVLRSAYQALGLDYPVSFRSDWCYRTMTQLTDKRLPREGTHHNALDDAVYQAKCLQAIWRQLDQSELRDMLRECQGQFNYYAEQHRLKIDPTLNQGSEDPAEKKMIVNQKWAERIGQLLDGGPREA